VGVTVREVGARLSPTQAFAYAGAAAAAMVEVAATRMRALPRSIADVAARGL
jgi:hypothetical protein